MSKVSIAAIKDDIFTIWKKHPYKTCDAFKKAIKAEEPEFYRPVTVKGYHIASVLPPVERGDSYLVYGFYDRIRSLSDKRVLKHIYNYYGVENINIDTFAAENIINEARKYMKTLKIIEDI